MGKQHPESIKIDELHQILLTADGLIKAIYLLAEEGTKHSEAGEAVYCLIDALKRLSSEGLTLSDHLIDVNWEVVQ